MRFIINRKSRQSSASPSWEDCSTGERRDFLKTAGQRQEIRPDNTGQHHFFIHLSHNITVILIRHVVWKYGKIHSENVLIGQIESNLIPNSQQLSDIR